MLHHIRFAMQDCPFLKIGGSGADARMMTLSSAASPQHLPCNAFNVAVLAQAFAPNKIARLGHL